jgi:hypothetical protein
MNLVSVVLSVIILIEVLKATSPQLDVNLIVQILDHFELSHPLVITDSSSSKIAVQRSKLANKLSKLDQWVQFVDINNTTSVLGLKGFCDKIAIIQDHQLASLQWAMYD